MGLSVVLLPVCLLEPVVWKETMCIDARGRFESSWVRVELIGDRVVGVLAPRLAFLEYESPRELPVAMSKWYFWVSSTATPMILSTCAVAPEVLASAATWPHSRTNAARAPSGRGCPLHYLGCQGLGRIWAR